MENMENILLSLEQDMIDTLVRWVNIDSVKAEATKDAPFGEGAKKALEEALKDCERLGFTTENIDNYAGHADLGTGSTQDALAILGHLDVVPVGDHWDTDPFNAVIKDGKMFGRGTSDDKGPVVAALFAMAAIKKANVPLKRKVRLILGTDEESGWQDIEYYKTKCEMPKMGFSPDADFPVINIEKGGMHIELEGKLSTQGLQVMDIKAGERANVVPGICTAVVKGDQALTDKINSTDFGFKVQATMQDNVVHMETIGVPAHGAMPEHGKNAIGQMLLVLKQLGAQGVVQTLADKIGMTYNGENMGIALEDKISGKLTCNMGIISTKENVVHVVLDLRTPVLTDFTQVERIVKLNFKDMDVTVTSQRTPHHVEESSELVQSLIKAYEEVTGNKGYAMAIGGGTYAKCLEEGVAYGSLFPGEEEMAHQANEYISIENLKKNLRIFTHAILKLAKA